jgi:NTE family protein
MFTKSVLASLVSLATTFSFFQMASAQAANGKTPATTAVNSTATTAMNSSATTAMNSSATTAMNSTETSATNSATTAVTNSATTKHPRVGLVLGGGGSRGSAHVGVLKVLVEEGIPIDLIAGTSIGSVVGGFYAAGVSLEELSNQFEKDTFIKEFMPMPLGVRLALEPILFIPRLVGYHPYDGLYKGKKFRKYADKVAGSPLIENLHIPFAAVCTNVVAGKTWRLTSGDLGTAMQASTAVPGLKKPVQIGNNLFCDGGLLCNLPVSHMREMGADFVIAVDIDEPLEDVSLDSFRKIGSMTRQALRVDLADQDGVQAKNADVLIHPNTSGITLISRKKSDASRGIEAGISAAREAMPEIKRKLSALGVLTTTNSKASK